MSRLPPGDLSFSPLRSLHFIRDPDGFFRESRERHGEPFCARLPPGNVAITTSPEGAREVFTADPDAFEPLSRLLLEPVVGDNSLLLLAGRGTSGSAGCSCLRFMGSGCAPTGR